jgi:magnesium-transporting ATPase (P-type)
MQAVAAMSAFFYVLQTGGWSYGQRPEPGNLSYLQATTACLTAIVVMQIANVLCCRSEHQSAFKSGLFRNRLLWLGIVVECVLILLIDYTSLGNRLFGTSPISLRVWLFIVPFAFGMLILEELRKFVARHLAFRASGG